MYWNWLTEPPPRMNNTSHSNYSTRSRDRSKQPVYTSDKRAKFTQRENKKWIRFLTVMGYVFFVSLPALSLSFYYIYIWDPGYIHRNESMGLHPVKYVDPIKEKVTLNPETKATVAPPSNQVNDKTTDDHIKHILNEGRKSMEEAEINSVGT